MDSIREIKRILILLSIFVLGLIATCSAYKEPIYVNADEFSIGGISIGSSKEYVQQIYGEPTMTSTRQSKAWGRVVVWTYGTTFQIEFSMNGNGVYTAHDIKTMGNNGLKTPSGFTVGTPLWKVDDKYGNALTYSIHKDRYQIADSWEKGMWFTTDSKGTITSIEVFLVP